MIFEAIFTLMCGASMFIPFICLAKMVVLLWRMKHERPKRN